ncbi:protein that induces appearance of [PIN+] prion when overproduced [Diplodia seriata]
MEQFSVAMMNRAVRNIKTELDFLCDAGHITPAQFNTIVPTDAGDLALQANDRVQVTEYMNAEWWKGRSERTGQEGIFPRSYVRVEDSKMPVAGPTPAQQSMGYGNMPMAVTQGGDQQNGQPSKGGEMGKKVGKKLGNAALFGAGATFGSNIVNGIM